MKENPPKIKKLREKYPKTGIGTGGGIDSSRAGKAVSAGANIPVTRNATFGKKTGNRQFCD